LITISRILKKGRTVNDREGILKKGRTKNCPREKNFRYLSTSNLFFEGGDLLQVSLGEEGGKMRRKGEKGKGEIDDRFVKRGGNIRKCD